MTRRKCEKRIDEALQDRIERFKKALDEFNKTGKIKEDDVVYESFLEWLSENCLAVSKDPHYRAIKLELSYGGPQDYFLFFDDGTIEYYFLDWFDGAKRELIGEDYEVMDGVASYLKEVINN